jgi:hypothetical protein
MNNNIAIFDMKSRLPTVTSARFCVLQRMAVCLLVMFGVGVLADASAQTKAQAKAAAAKAQAKLVPSPEARRLEIALDLTTNSQRVVKLYFQLVLDLDAERGREKLTESINIINADLEKLRKETLPAPATKALTEADATWATMIRTLATAPTKVGAEALQAPNSKLLDTLSRLDAELAKGAIESQAEVLILVSSQSALAQRITRAYFAHAIGLSGSPKARIPELMKRFVSIEEELEAFAGGDPKLKNDLDLIRVQIVFFKNIAERIDSATPADHLSMAKVSGRLLEVFTRIEDSLAH